MELLVISLIGIGFFVLAQHPILIAAFVLIMCVTGVIAFFNFRRQKVKVKSLASLIARNFFILTGLFLLGSLASVVYYAVSTSDPFFFAGAAPFLSGAFVTAAIASVSMMVAWYTRKKEKPVTIEKVGE